MERRALAALGVAAPFAALAAVAGSGVAPSPFQPLLALAPWLLAGYTALAAAWLALRSGARVGGRDVRAWAPALAVFGVVPFMAALAFADVLAVPGTTSYDLGHLMWVGLHGAALALVVRALASPRVPRHPLAEASALAAAVVAAALLGAPRAPPFLGPQGVTLVYDAAFGAFALGWLAASAPLWASWLRRGDLATLLAAEALVLLGAAAAGFLLQRTAEDWPSAWFGRLASVAATLLLLRAVTLTADAPAVRPRAPARAHA